MPQVGIFGIYAFTDSEGSMPFKGVLKHETCWQMPKDFLPVLTMKHLVCFRATTTLDKV